MRESVRKRERKEGKERDRRERWKEGGESEAVREGRGREEREVGKE